MLTSNLLNDYQQFSLLTKQMVHLARDQQWDLLLDCQTQYQQLSADLMGDGEITTIKQLANSGQQTILNYIKEILNHQQQLRQLIYDQHTKLGQLIGEKVSQHSHLQDYYQVANLI
ncbi:hypothetical protein A9G13_00805 [Gilliamella sp. wkB178]|uniref:flagellar protein FliT n=1 Tax=Gilliamella sp. wkB178 TaxID=3120259 RepID=UPI00080E53AD|nr:flagellar protein FliT [Gilliamella apicola]OCG10311.1 hypothetical protein A9G13_00805 [Gilliamella apicola]